MSEYRVLFVQRLFSFYQSAVAIIPAGISIYNLTADYTFSVIKYILIVWKSCAKLYFVEH